LSPEESHGKKCYELIGHSAPCDICATSEVYRTKQAAMVEKYFPEIDRWLDVRAYPILDENGKLCQVIEHLRDITERKRVEEELARTTREWQTTFDATNDAIWILSPDHCILRCNETSERLFHRPRGDLVGRHCWEIVHGTTHPIPECPMLRSRHSLRREVMEFKIGERWFQITVDPILDASGGFTGGVHFMTDITSRKRAEEERAKLQSQLLQAQKMESVGRLAGGVAHDFNNMLQAILGHTELALAKVDPSQPLFPDLQEIRKAAERSATLVRQLLAFARKQTISPKVLDLNETVKGMLKMLRRLIGEDLDLAWMPGQGLRPVKVDPSQIDQILANLAVNARDAVTGVGKLTIETNNVILDEACAAEHPGVVPGEYVLLAVSDNGVGMDKDVLKHLFEPFFTTKGVDKGTGLGLATVYGIVKQNNGFVSVYSEPGRGTTVKIFLPSYTGKIEERNSKEGIAQLPGGRETILLVEDDPGLLDMIRTLIERQGYTVLAANTPTEALSLAEKHLNEIHLVLTDVVMPEMNGRVLLEKLQSIRPGLKCLYMSGYTANVVAHQGVLDSGVQLIQKPFSAKALAEKVREILDEG
jgi:PAS domain S-box-containing protein